MFLFKKKNDDAQSIHTQSSKSWNVFSGASSSQSIFSKSSHKRRSPSINSLPSLGLKTLGKRNKRMKTNRMEISSPRALEEFEENQEVLNKMFHSPILEFDSKFKDPFEHCNNTSSTDSDKSLDALTEATNVSTATKGEKSLVSENNALMINYTQKTLDPQSINIKRQTTCATTATTALNVSQNHYRTNSDNILTSFEYSISETFKEFDVFVSDSFDLDKKRQEQRKHEKFESVYNDIKKRNEQILMSPKSVSNMSVFTNVSGQSNCKRKIPESYLNKHDTFQLLPEVESAKLDWNI